MKPREFIPMLDYVFEQRKKNDTDNIRRFWSCERYARLLSLKPELWMFVPCDDEGNVLEDPELTMRQGDGQVYYGASEEDFEQYQKAKDRVLFEGFEFRDRKLIGASNNLRKNILCREEDDYYYDFEKGQIWDIQFGCNRMDLKNCRLEDLTTLGLTLTENAVREWNVG